MFKKIFIFCFFQFFVAAGLLPAFTQASGQVNSRTDGRPSAQKSGPAQNSNRVLIPNKADDSALQANAKLTQMDADKILHRRKPDAQIMEIYIDSYKEKIIFWGKMFEDSPIKKTSEHSARSTKKKYVFAIDAHTGKFLYWKDLVFHFKYDPREDLPPEKMIDKNTAVHKARTLFPNSDLIHCEWNIVENLVYYDVTLYKDATTARYIVNAYSGKIEHSAQKANPSEALAQNDLSKEKLKEAVKEVLDGQKAAMMARVEYSTYDVERYLASKIPGGIVTNLNLNLDFNYPFYEGSVVHDNKYYRFKLNAETGAVMEWKRKVFHSPIMVTRQGSHTVTMPVPPSVPIENIQIPTVPHYLPPDAPNAPMRPMIPAIPNMPLPPAYPNPPAPPKPPVPRL